MLARSPPVRGSPLAALQLSSGEALSAKVEDGKSRSASRRRRLQNGAFHHGKLDTALQQIQINDELCPSPKFYICLLQACIKRQALSQAKQIHDHLVRHKAKLTGVLGDYLVVTLAKCGGVELAFQISNTLPHRTVFSWTSIISAYCDSGQAHMALDMYRLMLADGVQPDDYTFVTLLKACGSIKDLEQGRNLHMDIDKMGFASNVFVGNTLVSMYGKCGSIPRAERAFCALFVRSEIAYNAMLSVYVEQDCAEKAVRLFRQMLEEKVSPNELTFAITIQACISVAQRDEGSKETALEIGQAIHHAAHLTGFDSDTFVGNMLVSIYGILGMVAEAEMAFGMLLSYDLKSWTIMLSVYTEQGEGERALRFYRYLYTNKLMCPDSHVFVTALQACGALLKKNGPSLVDGVLIKETALEMVQALHADARMKGLTSDVFVGTALLTMYAKCGKLAEAESLFKGLPLRSVVSWTAMLSAYVEHDQHAEALGLYRHMLEELVPLDDVTIICILQACSETGNSEICKDLHFAIVHVSASGSKASLPSTLVHAYSSCASMADADAVLNELTQPDVVSWSACIAGYAGEGRCGACLWMLEAMQFTGVKPNEITFASILAACSHAGLILVGLEYFASMTADHLISPKGKHYVNMTDLLGRTGDFRKLQGLLDRMPIHADLTLWLCLLGVCVKHGNLNLAKQAFNQAVTAEPTEAVTYILMSNIFADAQLEVPPGR